EEDPKNVICKIEAQIDFAKDLIDLLSKKDSSYICRNNENKERCKWWIENNLSEAKYELKNAEQELIMLKKNHRSGTNRSQSVRFFKEVMETVDFYMDKLEKK